MRVYRNSIYVTAIISVITLIVSFNLQDGIYYDILMGVFSGAILTLVTSIVGYRVERMKTLKDFMYNIRSFLKEISNYEGSMSLERKIYYYLDLVNKDLDEITIAYENIAFVYDIRQKDKEYIENKIFSPIVDLYNRVTEHKWHFKWYIDGSGRNDRVIEDIVKELENLILEKQVIKIEGVESNPNYTYTYNKFTKLINKELLGRYHEIMYGKRIHNKKLNEERDQ